MHIGRRYRFLQTLHWSRREALLPLAWAFVATSTYEVLGQRWMSLPWLPMSLVGVGVAFYLGFKNNASYDRLWEARKIWGAIVNASRSWAFSSRDLLIAEPAGASRDELREIHLRLVRRHVAWLDALRHQLRRLQTWEHRGADMDRIRELTNVPEYKEDLREQLLTHLPPAEVDQVLAQINPAAHLLANQSAELGELRRRGLIDGFAHQILQQLTIDLMAEQGKAERIKNFPFPRQYATVNSIYALLFATLVPFGMLREFEELGQGMVWLTVPFSTLVSWVFLTMDRIGDWSENPFEGLANDVPISAMARGIERDVLQIAGETELRPARQPDGMLLF
jgi:putative membrane protein